MGSFSIWHWLIVLVVVLILFGGRGKISQLMADVGKGLKSFRKNIRDDETTDESAKPAEQKAIPAAHEAGLDATYERDRTARS